MTIFRPLSPSRRGGRGFTLCEVSLLTGRKHQIRAHAQWLGHSVAGDKIYGPDETLYLDFVERGFTPEMAEILPIKRQALHAAAMDFGDAVPELTSARRCRKTCSEIRRKIRIEVPEKYL